MLPGKAAARDVGERRTLPRSRSGSSAARYERWGARSASPTVVPSSGRCVSTFSDKPSKSALRASE